LRGGIILETDLPHVRQVKQTDGFADGSMLLADAGVLQRHEPATEVRDLGAEADVFLIQRCPLGGPDQTSGLVVVKLVDLTDALLVVQIARLTEHPEYDS